MSMSKTFILAAASIVAIGAMPMILVAKPFGYQLPEETAAFKSGPNLEVVQSNCAACHSADYINTQPQGPKFKKDFWHAEVMKMINVYGAPIDEADVGKIVEYLSQTY
jgi:mono/diheme cytochrome c family protein